MRPMIGAVAVAALAIGGAVIYATSRPSRNAQAYQSSAPAAAAPAPVVPNTLASGSVSSTEPRPVMVAEAAPATTRVVSRERVVYRQTPVRRRVVVHKRSTKKSVAIIGGSTVGGAVVGGLIGGKKGAVIGGVAGGAAGTVYDRKTRKKKRVE